MEIFTSRPAIPVILPDLGAGAQPLSVSAWFVEPGDPIEEGDPIVEVLTSGITCDVCSPAGGRVSRLAKDIDAAVRPGEVLAWIDPAPAGIAGDSE